MTVDITIPVLDEEATLAKNISTLEGFMTNHFPDKSKWQIVIADNGSRDRTLEIGEELAKEFSNVKIITVPDRGVGLALKTSWGQSEADIVGYMDLDLATDLVHFPQAYAALVNENYDLVYGTRLHANSKVIGRTLKREISSRGFNFLLKTYLGVGFSDGMCGFKFLKRSVYPDLFEGGAQNNGWFFSTELLTVAEWQGKKIKELPVTWTDDVSSSRVKILPLAKRYITAMQALKKLKP